jgi:hypothetical protein
MRILKALCALLMFCSITALSSPALAQGRGFGVRVQFGRDRDVERLLRQAEFHTNQFASMVADRDRFGLNERANDLRSQLNMVGGDYDRTSDRYDNRAQMLTVLRVAGSINTALRYRRVDFVVQRQWEMVRSDLNRLARAYNLRQIA